MCSLERTNSCYVTETIDTFKKTHTKKNIAKKQNTTPLAKTNTKPLEKKNIKKTQNPVAGKKAPLSKKEILEKNRKKCGTPCKKTTLCKTRKQKKTIAKQKKTLQKKVRP